MAHHAKLAKRFPRVSGTFVPLLAALLTVLVVAPLAEHHPRVASLLISLLLLTGVFTVHRNPPLRLAAVLGLLFALSLRWLTHFLGSPHRGLLLLSHLTIGGYMAFLAAIVVFTVVTHREITRNTVMGAMCGYLLIAYIFAFWYVALEDFSPGSIAIANWSAATENTAQFGGGAVFMYFSFVTLTTLGYGDVLPVSPLARSLVTLEVLSGQLYLAAFVARLVGVMKVHPGNGDEAAGKSGNDAR